MQDDEFTEKCLKERTITVSSTVSIIKRKELMNQLAQRHKDSSEYFLDGAQVLLASASPLLAILSGYFSMEHKSNQLLALKGYNVESHICTQMALSRIVSRKDLARKISLVFEARQNVGYRMFLKHNEEERKHAVEIIDNEVMPFLKEVDGLVEKEI